MQIRSASKLHPCGWVDVLGRVRVRTQPQRKAMEFGTAVHAVLADGISSPDAAVNDMARILRGMSGHPGAPVPRETELALGLSANVRYVEVVESTPHVYESPHGEVLLTAGRADLCWTRTGATGVLIACLRDYKTGKYQAAPAVENLQTAALGFAYADKVGASIMDVGLVYTWGLDAVTIDLDSSTAADLWDAVEKAATIGEVARPGPWCRSCWERKACEFAKESA